MSIISEEMGVCSSLWLNSVLRRFLVLSCWYFAKQSRICKISRWKSKHFKNRIIIPKLKKENEYSLPCHVISWSSSISQRHSSNVVFKWLCVSWAFAKQKMEVFLLSGFLTFATRSISFILPPLWWPSILSQISSSRMNFCAVSFCFLFKQLTKK